MKFTMLTRTERLCTERGCLTLRAEREARKSVEVVVVHLRIRILENRNFLDELLESQTANEMEKVVKISNCFSPNGPSDVGLDLLWDDDVRALSLRIHTHETHKQPTQVTSKERMNLSFIGFFGPAK